MKILKNHLILLANRLEDRIKTLEKRWNKYDQRNQREKDHDEGLIYGFRETLRDIKTILKE